MSNELSTRDAGQRDMVDFRMTFFYSSAAIALHEAFSVPADSILGFLERVAAIMGEEKSVEKIKQKALDITGVDVAYADTPPLPVKTSRSDKKVIDRMRKTGITQNDLEEEKQIGYQHGWNTQFFLSACYAATALVLQEMYNSSSDQIERFLDRIEEITDSEISRKDILDRCHQETGLEVSGLIPGLV